MSSKDSGSKGSLGFCTVLTLIFITLKLLGKITWSWFWVLSPMIIPIMIIIIFVFALWVSTRR